MAASFCDVAVVGGGPAGSATALSLRAQAPALSVVLIEASGYNAPRLGESLPPAAARILEHLGLAGIARTHAAQETPGTAAAWGADDLLDHDFIYEARGAGWHLDRGAFDAALAAEAESRGARRLREIRVRAVARSREGWQLVTSGGGEMGARFLVDATGRAASMARACGARVTTRDRLLSLSRLFEDQHPDSRTVVESWKDGWWYTAGLPGGRRLVACLTDADLVRRHCLSDEARWTSLLEATTHVAARARGRRPCGPLVARATESRLLSPAAGPDWIAVGDAASVVDPLSSQGITKALRSGIFASYAIGDWLGKGDASGLARYRRFVEHEFASYLDQRAAYYAQETRWPDQEFWQRRGSA